MTEIDGRTFMGMKVVVVDGMMPGSWMLLDSEGRTLAAALGDKIMWTPGVDRDSGAELRASKAFYDALVRSLSPKAEGNGATPPKAE